MATGISFIALLGIVLILILVVVCVAGTIFLIVRRKPTGDAMSCGKCGYAVRGASSLTCPECGADLREVGINRPDNKATPWVLVAVIVSGVLLLGCVCAGAFSFVGVRSSVTPPTIIAPPPPTVTTAPPAVTPEEPAPAPAPVDPQPAPSNTPDDPVGR